MTDGYTDTPYKKAAVKRRRPKGCSGNAGAEHYYVYDRVVYLPSNLHHDRLPYCLFCDHKRRKYTKDAELARTIYVTQWTNEEIEKVPSRRFTLRVVRIENA